ncbi:MAG: hypothetical protein H6518_11720 [Microthrixaceae bacterium]|nr:hypothetical protein [Microthrixaceae bacterium]
MRLPDAGILRPATLPPDFDLTRPCTRWTVSAERRPAGIALAHFGLVPDLAEILAEAHDTLAAGPRSPRRPGGTARYRRRS